MKEGVSIIIPTWNGGQLFHDCLEMIRQQVYEGPIQLMVIDSGSSDGTPDLAAKMGAAVYRINKRRFHHARTRNEALRGTGFERVVFMVQDAVPVSTGWLSGLVAALDGSGAAAVYTDQIPHGTATLYARFETECISQGRGDQPVLQGIESLESFRQLPYHQAYRTLNLDNVCAIYRKEVLLKHPFPEMAFAEDMAWALQVLLKRQKILYQPSIKVRHSHNRSTEYGFRRQIVNSFWVARIMNRVEADLSFLGVADLMVLTGQADEFVGRLRAGICGRKGECGCQSEGWPGGIERMVRESSLENRLLWWLRQRVTGGGRHPPSPRLKFLYEEAQQRIQWWFNGIVERYHPTEDAEIMEALDRISANVLGRIYGETYASCMVHGKVPFGIARLMRPFMGGV